VFAVTITTVAIAVACAGHRLWTRAFGRREVGPCDVLISFAAVRAHTEHFGKMIAERMIVAFRDVHCRCLLSTAII
jgi:hypothetical protein